MDVSSRLRAKALEQLKEQQREQQEQGAGSGGGTPNRNPDLCEQHLDGAIAPPLPFRNAPLAGEEQRRRLTVAVGNGRHEPCCINKLPVELLITIFQRLALLAGTPAAVEVAAKVCRAWRRAGSCEAVWSMVCRRWVPGLPLLRLVVSSSSSSNSRSGAPQQQQPPSDLSNMLMDLSKRSTVQKKLLSFPRSPHLIGGSPNFTTTTTTTPPKTPPPGGGATAAGASVSNPGSTPLKTQCLSPPLSAAPAFDPAVSAFLREHGDNSTVMHQLSPSTLSAARKHDDDSTCSGNMSHEEKNNSKSNSEDDGVPIIPLTRNLVTLVHNELMSHIAQFHKYVLVEHQRRYTVNIFISFLLFALAASSLCFVVALELPAPPHDPAADGSSRQTQQQQQPVALATVWALLTEPSAALVASSIISVDAGFRMLWLALLFGFAAVITNIIMASHFAPQPLVERVRGHWKLISLSVMVLLCIVFAIAFPLYAIQRNVQMCWGRVGQWHELGCLPFRWMVACSPVAVSLFAWQALVFHNTARNGTIPLIIRVDEEDEQQHQHQQRDNMEEPAAATGGDLIDENIARLEAENEQRRVMWAAMLLRLRGVLVVAGHWVKMVVISSGNLTPAMLGCGVLSFAWYLETGNVWMLALSVVPFLVCVLVLLALFMVDFAVGGALADGIAVIGLILMALTPVTVIFFPIRGLTGLPAIIALTAAFVGYADRTWKLLLTVDDLGAFQ